MCGGILQRLLRRKRSKKSGFGLVKEIPIPHNAFITTQDNDFTECRGFENWTSPKTIWTIFFRISKPDKLRISIRLCIPSGNQSSFKFSWNDDPTEVEVNVKGAEGGEDRNVFLQEKEVTEEGYLGINLQGLAKSGEVIAEVRDLLVTYTDPTNEIIFNTTDVDPSVGRRGPSLKLSYPLPSDLNIETYYCELSFPLPGTDFVGEFAVPIAFSGGSLGIKYNGLAARQIIFSLKNEYDKNDVNENPLDYKIELVKQNGGIFEEDDSGDVRSIVSLNWLSQVNYKFLVQSKPIDHDSSTEIAAWFMKPTSYVWELVARFRKTKSKGGPFLRDFHSVLTNLEPDKGHIERVVYFGNQWARDWKGHWYECISANFSVDPVTIVGRMDYAAGSVEGDFESDFYLRHNGFFSDLTVGGSHMVGRCAIGKAPRIDFKKLP